MWRYRFFLPPALLIGLSVALGLLLVEATMAVLAPRSPPGMRITLCVIAAIVTTIVSGVGVHWLVVVPFRRIRRMIYRLTEGDFAARTGSRGIAMTADIMQALDVLAGRLEARCEAARVAERRYRLFFENSPAGFFRTRLDGRLVECNMAAVRMLGYDSLTDAKTRNVRTFYADPLERPPLLERLARENVVTNLLIDFRRKDGRVIPVLLTLHRIVETDGPHFEGQFVEAGEFGLHGSASESLMPVRASASVARG